MKVTEKLEESKKDGQPGWKRIEITQNPIEKTLE